MRRLVVLFGVVGFAVGCNLQDISSQLTASKVMVATLFTTPEVKVNFVETFDAGGLGGFDAGTIDAGVVTVPAQTQAFVFFGERPTIQSTDINPILDATVNMVAVGGATTNLKHEGGGKYSAKNPEVTYETGKTYQFDAKVAGETYQAEVSDSPAAEGIADFHPAKGFVELTAKSPFTFNRPAPPAGKDRPLGLTTVVPIATDGTQGPPTYSDLKDPKELLQIITNVAKYKTATVTIPGTAFPDAGKTYLIIFQALQKGSAKSTNLSAASAILTGGADVGVVRTK